MLFCLHIKYLHLNIVYHESIIFHHIHKCSENPLILQDSSSRFFHVDIFRPLFLPVSNLLLKMMVKLKPKGTKRPMVIMMPKPN